MSRFTVLGAAVVATAILTAGSAMAQSYLDGASKARGDYGQASASRALGSARSYAQDFSRYVQATPKVEKEVAMETADAIGDYITKAKKHFAWMRANAQ